MIAQKIAKEAFVCEDLVSMTRFLDVIQKMDKCLDDITLEAHNLFGNIEKDSFQDMREYRRYAIWKTGILLPHSNAEEYPPESTILMGFQLDDPNGAPELSAHFFVRNDHEKYGEFMSQVNKDTKLGKEGVTKPMLENDYGCYASFDKSLSDFISNKNQFSEIKSWFIEKMKILEDFISRTPQLGWNLANLTIAKE